MSFIAQAFLLSVNTCLHAISNPLVTSGLSYRAALLRPLLLAQTQIRESVCELLSEQMFTGFAFRDSISRAYRDFNLCAGNV